MEKNVLKGIVIEDGNLLTLEEFCMAAHADRTLVIEMVEYQLLTPEGNSPEVWRFDSVSLRRMRIANSFYHDLEVNLPGIALALDLLDKIDDAQRQLRILKRQGLL